MKHTGTAFSYVTFAALLIVTICISLISLSCTNDAVIDPMNPNIKPEIISTYPVNGSVGPFDNVYPNGSHFYIHFNKLMDRSSFTHSTITCEGFNFPVEVNNDYYNYYSNYRYGDILGFYIQRRDNNDPYPYSIPYLVNTTFTIQIDSTVKDFNGNRLGYQCRFSFKPEPYFRVIDYSFKDGDTLNPTQYQSVSVRFNSRIASNTLSALTLEPPLQGTWRVSYDDSTWAFFSLSGSIAPSRKITVSIPQSVSDRDGNQTIRPASRSFNTLPFRLRSIEPFPGVVLSLLARQEFYFTYPVDTQSVSSALTISPNIPISLYVQGNMVGFRPANDFAQNASYTVTFSTQLRTDQGSSLLQPLSYNFRTKNFNVWHEITGLVTSNAGYPRLPTIVFRFSGRIDTASFRSALSVSPPIVGVYAFQPVFADGEYYYESYEAYFAPKTFLPPFTTYHVKLDSSVRSIGGYKLAYPDTFSFTTGGSSEEARIHFDRGKPIPIK